MNIPELLLKAIDSAPGEWTPVLMLADWNDENGCPESAGMIRAGAGWMDGDGGYGDGGYGYGGGGGGDGGGGYGGGDGGGGYGGDGGGGGGGDGGGGYGGDGGGGGGGDGGDGVADDGGGDDGYGYKISRGFAMTMPGLYIICSPGGYYPYVRIGWCSRADGMIQMRNCRVIRRFGANAQLAKLAESGPESSTQLLEMAKVEFVSAGMVSRSIPCNAKAWAKECPKPMAEEAEVEA